MDESPTADLFSSDPGVARNALAGMAAMFRAMVSSEAWGYYRDYVDRLRKAKALEAFTQGETDQESAKYIRGYLAGLQDSIDSAENLARRGAQAVEEEKDEARNKKARFRRPEVALAGRGGRQL